jgi:hypothetical protein
MPCHTLPATGHFGKARLGFECAHEKGLIGIRDFGDATYVWLAKSTSGAAEA